MAEAVDGPVGRDRSFGPTVLVGLGAGALTAVAAARDWATATATAAGGGQVEATARGSASAPLGVALALVALAAWGVVLVLRGRSRQVVSVVGALAAAGVLASVLAARQVARHDAVEAVLARGGTSQASASLTAWYVVCGLGALATLASFAVAVRASPRWPAMGSRYDAPSARRTAAAAAGSTGLTGSAGSQGSEGSDGSSGSSGASGPSGATEQDLWRALDDGHDPTA